MVAKPTSAAGYTPDYLELVRATCLYIATKLGDLMQDLVVVGGLAPSLLVDQDDLPAGADRHVGTTDLDVGLTVALLDEGRYTTLSDRLRRAGFAPDEERPGKHNASAVAHRRGREGHSRLPDRALDEGRRGRYAPEH